MIAPIGFPLRVYHPEPEPEVALVCPICREQVMMAASVVDLLLPQKQLYCGPCIRRRPPLTVQLRLAPIQEHQEHGCTDDPGPDDPNAPGWPAWQVGLPD